MANKITVGIADMKLVEKPDLISTIGLGSCVGVVIYDKISKNAGLVHCLLPDSTKISNNQNIYKFADTGIKALYDELIKKGCHKESLRAKMAGGASVFEFTKNSPLGGIGEKNTNAAKQVLSELGVKLVAEDCGANYGRTIVYDTETFELNVIKAGKSSMVI